MAEKQEEHVYHHYDNDAARINVSVEKNSKGYNWSATVIGAKTVDEALKLLKLAQVALQDTYGTPVKE